MLSTTTSTHHHICFNDADTVDRAAAGSTRPWTATRAPATGHSSTAALEPASSFSADGHTFTAVGTTEVGS